MDPQNRCRLTHTIIRLHARLFHQRLHQTPLLILDIARPIGLTGRDEHMRRPPVDVTVQVVILVDGEVARVVERAGRTCLIAVWSVDQRIDGWEEADAFCSCIGPVGFIIVVEEGRRFGKEGFY